jgi:CspA family cold shock protein
MGRYKEFREPKRRGYDDDYAPPAWVADRAPTRPKPPAPAQTPPGSEPVEAIVKWYNPEKGFGFVAVTGGSDAFLHVRVLETAGYSSVGEGARLKVRIGQGEKGSQVSELLEVDASTASATGKTKRVVPPRPVSHRGPVDEASEDCVGSVMWYNAEKGFGFVGSEDGGKDVFVHATTLERCGLSGLAEGQRVRMKVGQGQKGREARSIELLG